jgi:hypothetical protein
MGQRVRGSDLRGLKLIFEVVESGRGQESHDDLASHENALRKCITIPVASNPRWAKLVAESCKLLYHKSLVYVPPASLLLAPRDNYDIAFPTSATSLSREAAKQSAAPSYLMIAGSQASTG